MMNLKDMPLEAFSVIVSPPDTTPFARITVNADGVVVLSSKVAEQFAKKPVELSFNEVRNVIQVKLINPERSQDILIFPKSGRKTIPNAVEELQKKNIPLPAEYRGYIVADGIWRGAHYVNPTMPPANSTRNTKKK